MTDPAADIATLRSHTPEYDGHDAEFTAALDRVEAHITRLTQERDEWMTPFDGSGIIWHESLPNPYTYEASDFSALVAAVHEYEARAEAAERALADMTADRDKWKKIADDLALKTVPAIAYRLADTREALARAVFLAEHLWQMVPQSAWRDHGADDGQGHYEGDYHAEKVREELRALAAPQKPQPVESLLDDDDYAVLEMDNAPQEPRDCEHDYVFSAENEYRCDKCGQISKDGVYPRVGPYPQEPQP